MDERIVRPPVEREVDEELAFHLEMRVRELMEGGLSEEEARAEAERRLGDVERVKARMRYEGKAREGTMNRRQWWDELGQDLLFALRQLRRGPGFAVVAIVTLALAIGANTAVFSVVNGVVLRPLPFPQPEQLTKIYTRYLPVSGFDLPRFAISGPEYFDVKDGIDAFQRVGAVQGNGSRALTGDGEDAERVTVAFFSSDVFPLLGVRPWLGRWFSPEEDAPNGPDVTVLSYDLWSTRYGADSTLVGRTILMNGTPTEVVGVMPSSFDFPTNTLAWLPLGLDRSNAGNRGGHGLTGVARLAPGRTFEEAEAELEVMKANWAAEYPHNVGHFAWTQRFKDSVLGDAPRTLWVLLTAVGLVLLVACVNVANLLLARGERRHAEVAVRQALGAGRGRITRQLLTESFVLATIAAALGLGLAQLGTHALIRTAPDALPRLGEVSIDGRVLLFTLGVAFLTAGLFGTLPGLLASRRGLARTAGARSGVGRGSTLLRRGLVSAEVALSLMVVVAAGLLVKSWVALDRTDRGMDTSNLLTFAVTLTTSSVPNDARVPEEFDRLLERMRAVPGAAAVTATSNLPFSGGYAQWDFQLDDRPPRQEGDKAWNAGVATVEPGFFETLGIPILAGRGIEAGDKVGAPLVGVVSEAMASTYWPGEDPIGKRWGYSQSEDSTAWITVVGVARDAVWGELGEEPYPFVWVPQAQAGVGTFFWPRTMRVAIRTGAEPASLVPAVRAAMKEYDPNLPMYRVQTMDDAVADTLARPRLTTNLLGLFALLALVLATVGIYGVVSYAVAGRTREIGIRVALGARRGEVVRMVLAEGTRPVLLGVAIGLVGAWFGTRLVAAMLYQVAPRDPVTFALIAGALILVGTAACWVPARRATSISPTRALREE